jgi:hypothetical protein
MLLDVCTFVGLIILYLLYDWRVTRQPAAPGSGATSIWPGMSRCRSGSGRPALKAASPGVARATRLTLVPGTKREQRLAK